MSEPRTHTRRDLVLTLCAVALCVAALVWAVFYVRPATPRFTSPADVVHPQCADAWRIARQLEAMPPLPPAPPAYAPFTPFADPQRARIGVSLARIDPRLARARETVYGERVPRMTDTYAWKVGDQSLELVALATYRRRTMAIEEEAKLSGLSRASGEPLTTASLGALGVPSDFILDRERFNGFDEQTKLTLLMQMHEMDRLDVLNLEVFDARTSAPLSSAFTCAVQGDWMQLTVTPTILYSRPLRVFLTLSQATTQALNMEAQPMAQVVGRAAALRLQNVVHAEFSNGPLDDSDLWRYPNDDREYFFVGVSLPIAADQSTGSNEANPPLRSPSTVLLFDSVPDWAARGFRIKALDQDGRVLELVHSFLNGGTLAKQFLNTHGPPVKLQVNPPGDVLRIEFEIARLPGLPELRSGDLLDQRVLAYSYQEPWELKSFLESHGQLTFTGIANDFKLGTGSRVRRGATLRELLLEYEAEAGLADTTLAPSPRGVPVPGAYEWYRPSPSRWQILVHWTKRKLGMPVLMLP